MQRAASGCAAGHFESRVDRPSLYVTSGTTINSSAYDNPDNSDNSDSRDNSDSIENGDNSDNSDDSDNSDWIDYH